MSVIQDEVNNLITQYQKLFLQRAMLVVRDEFIAQDIVQEAFIKYIKIRRENLTEIKNAKNWFYQVIRNLSLDYLRKQKVRQKYVIPEPDDSEIIRTAPLSDTPQNILLQREREEEALELLKTLSDREYRMVTMKVLKQKSYKEIAQLENISVANVGVVISNAFKKLRKKSKGDQECKTVTTTNNL